MAKVNKISRRTLLKGVTLSHLPVWVGLPPLEIQFNGRGAGGASLDQLVAAQIGGESRFRSLEIGVSQESFGESIQRNMSWAGRDRALPPEMIPSKLFDRLFGRMEEGWINRKRSILDAVREDAAEMRKSLGKDDQTRVEEHVSSIRDLERSI